MIDLAESYRRLTQPWTQEELGARYEHAERCGARLLEPDRWTEVTRPIALLANAIPPSSHMNVAVHVLHLLPGDRADRVSRDLIETAARNAALALRHCHRVLELDGAAHDYTAEEWLPTVYTIAAPLLQAARLDQEPPSIVAVAQDAVSWLSRSVAELAQDSAETPSALAETIARLLTVCVFADEARRPDDHDSR